MGISTGKGGESSKNVPFAGMGATSQGQNELALGETGQAWDRLAEFQPKFEDTIWPYAENFMDETGRAAHAATSFAGDVQKSYEGLYTPLLQKFVGQAQDYASPARQDLESGIAAQTQAAAADQAINTTKRQLASYGISPTEGLIAGGALDLGRSASIAAAASGARRGVYDTSLGLEKSALDLMGTQPTQFANLANVGGNLGAAGVTAGDAALKTGADVLGGPLGWADAAGRAFSGAGSTMSGQASAANAANQQSLTREQDFSKGIGNIVGTGLKLATAFI